MEQNKQIAAQLLERNGTFTLDGDPVTFDRGFQVGGADHGIVNPTLLQATQWVADVRSDGLNRQDPVTFLGSWTDENGNVYLDVTDHVADYEAAQVLGRLSREKTIWNWQIGRAIPVCQK